MAKIEIKEEELNQPSDNIMELVVVENEIGKLAINYEQLKKQLGHSLKVYDTYEVTLDNIPTSKSERANLNKLVKIIEDKRKDLKKEFLKPYELVETQCKELVGMVNQVVGKIDGGIKSFEEKAKEEKLEQIRSYFNSHNFNLVPFERLYDSKWLNVAVKQKDWQDEIDSKIFSINQSLALLDSFNVTEPSLLKTYYLETLDLASAKSRYDSIIAQREMFERVEKVEVKEVEKQEKVNTVADMVEPKYEIMFSVKITEKQLNRLCDFLEDNGIEYIQVGD